ncbi:hypothetical protein SAMN05660642_01032 [Geodermatophilus siccatus]|uniref:Uncharacterized protein n=1 Tax=Geodermatophilus siccatus TaxID=1137991 RepID=A0A1G9NH06_9ACTN|nr:hypothetical protein [Geodermatophilus siccatus]SDL85671.1 hypothetical protein SAMN05660642_01032 [Geodermatophilus siccatus]
MPVTDVPLDGPDRSVALDERTERDAPERREYSRPRAFSVGPATKLVRGGIYGKAHDGYTGYYLEP